VSKTFWHWCRSVQHFGPSAEVSQLFCIGAEVSTRLRHQCRNVLGPKCLRSEVSVHQAEQPTIVQLVESNDDTLLCRVISCSSHLLHKLLPNRRNRTIHGYQLRQRPHDRILAASDDTRNYIHRLLHRNVY